MHAHLPTLTAMVHTSVIQIAKLLSSARKKCILLEDVRDCGVLFGAFRIEGCSGFCDLFSFWE